MVEEDGGVICSIQKKSEPGGAVDELDATTGYWPLSRGGHVGQRTQISYTDPRVDMDGNEFTWSERKVFGSGGLNMATF